MRPTDLMYVIFLNCVTKLNTLDIDDKSTKYTNNDPMMT